MNMRLRTEHNRINDNLAKSGNNGQSWFDEDSVLSSHDQALLRLTGEYLTAMSDIEEVKNDPDYLVASSLAVEMIREYKEKPVWSRDNEKFIRESFEKAEEEKSIIQEISEIKAEAEKKGVFETAEEWVNDWNRRKVAGRTETDKIREIENFVTGSLNNEISEPEVRYNNRSKKPVVKILRYVAIPAAAAIGMFIMLRIFTAPFNTEKIYSEIYQPLPAITGITRGGAATIRDNFSEGIVKYRKGDYYGAALSFSEAMKTDSSSFAVKFYQGITQIALGNYSSAVNLLENITGSETEYGKDACWYLGLAYLKLGEKEKALKYLIPLSESQGFYRDKARKIVRRLR